MSSGRGHGLPVDTDEAGSALESTRMLRLVLNVLWSVLPNDMVGPGPVLDALESIHDRINETEVADLRTWGLAEHYLIIRPVSLVSPPRQRRWKR
jgi:hypothetical protein